jgi:hypothetical protein
MADLSTEDRRTDIINNLTIRLAVLEATHNELMNTRLAHAAVLEKLSTQDTALVLSLTTISIKFDELIKQIAMGIKIIFLCTGVVATVIGAFYKYSKDLDERYSPKLESIVTNTVDQKAKIDATSKASIENTAKINAQANKIDDVSGKVTDVTDDVTAIKKLKAVKRSR